MNKFLQLFLLCLLAVTLMTINTFVPHLEYGITQYKQYFFLPLLLATQLFSLLLIRYNKPPNFKGSLPLTLSISFLFLYGTISILLFNYFTQEDLLNFWLPFLFFGTIITLQIPSNNNIFLKRTIFLTYVLVLLFQVIIGILQKFMIFKSYNNLFPITGTFDNPAGYAIFVSSTSIFLITFCLLEYRSRLIYFLTTLCALLMFFVLYYILSRAALIGFTVSFALISLYMYPTKRYRKKIYLSLAALVVLTIFIFLLTIKKDSTNGRLVIWKISSAEIMKNPIFGSGPGRFAPTYNIQQSNYFAKNIEKRKTEGFLVDYIKTPVNDYLQILYEQGFVGLIVYIFILIFLFRYFFSIINSNQTSSTPKPSSIGIASFFAILVILISCAFSDPLYHFPIIIVFFFHLAMIARDFKIPSSENNSRTWRVSTICIIILSVYSYIIAKDRNTKILTVLNGSNLKEQKIHSDSHPIQNEYYYISKSEQLLIYGNADEVISELQIARTRYSHWKIYINLGMAYRILGNYKAAEDYIIIAYNMVPHLVYPKFLLAKIYYESNQFKKFIDMAYQVLYDKEKVPSDKINGMRAEIALMLEKFKKITIKN